MSTRSTVGAVQRNGLIKAIYVHFDGYPSGVGHKLKMFYSTAEKLEELLNLGDLSILDDQIGEKQIPGKRRPGTCLAYGRDYDEADVEAKFFPSISKWLPYYSDSQYAYLFNGGVWEIVSSHTKTPKFLGVGRQVADQE
jgi:hypothetical protein